MNIRNEFGRLGVGLVLVLGACTGDDGGDDGDAVGSTGTTTAADTDPQTTDDPSTDGGSTDTGGDTDDPTTDTGDSTGADSTGDDTTGDPTTGGMVDEGTYAALVRGDLFTDDLMMAQGLHDMIAMGGEEAAMALGDFGHDAKLGTTLLGGTENTFLGLDQWDNLAGAEMLYSDPKFGEAFNMLFAEPPLLELFELQEEWHGWGDLEAGDGGDHWFVVVRGTLAANTEDSQELHDMVAAAGEADAMAAGDVAHVVWLGVNDTSDEFFAIDVWTDDANIEAFYGNPKFQKAFGALFSAPPSVAVYRSTDWYQW